MSNSRKRVALLVETSHGSGRSILRGIARYAHQSNRWQLIHAARGLQEVLPDWLRRWRGDGVIARIQDASMLEALKKMTVPVVDTLGVAPEGEFPLVHVDDRRIGRDVARYFEERGFRHFGFFGFTGENWSERRREAFCETCRTFSTTETVAEFERPRTGRDGALGAAVGEALGEWLRDQPKPLAVMVSSDQLGLALLEACRDEGLAVPEQVAVVGVDDDVPLCEISSPPLTSVRAGHERVGFEAARLLEVMMAGEADPAELLRASPLLVPPTGIVTRQSSGGIAIDDPVVAKGLHFLHGHLDEAISNQSIASAAGVSRTVFQKRFRNELGVSIRDYLVRQRLRRARDLIENSDLTFADIAQRSGFKHQEYLGYVVQKHLGATPGQLRRAAVEGR